MTMAFSAYDENIYTKKLDKDTISKAQMERADRLAREIERSASSNIHIQEERGQISEQVNLIMQQIFSNQYFSTILIEFHLK